MKTIWIEVQPNDSITGWSSSPVIGGVEIEIEENHPVMLEFGYYAYRNGELIRTEEFVLEQIREQKIKELEQAYQDATNAGFNYTINAINYLFPSDTQSQMQMQVNKMMLDSGMTRSVNIVALQDGVPVRVAINKIQISELIMACMAQMTAYETKYWDDLLPLVQAATTVDEVKTIIW